jgi:hypothetical protein
VNSEQLSLDLFTSVSYLEPVQRVLMTYQKCNKRLSVIDVELRVTDNRGRLCTEHDRLRQPALVGKTRLFVYHGSLIAVDPPHFSIKDRPVFADAQAFGSADSEASGTNYEGSAHIAHRRHWGLLPALGFARATLS